MSTCPIFGPFDSSYAQINRLHCLLRANVGRVCVTFCITDSKLSVLIEQPSFSAPTSHEPAPLVSWKHVSGDNPLLDSSRPGVGMAEWRIGWGIIL